MTRHPHILPTDAAAPRRRFWFRPENVGLSCANPTYLIASMHYRRAFTPGGSFFFTLVSHGRRLVFANAQAIEISRNAFRTVRTSRPFEIDAMVVMPDHLHCIWTLPPGDADFSTRWRLIKTWFTKHCEPDQRTQAVWQQRYWEHQLRDETDLHPVQPCQARPGPIAHGVPA